MLRCSRARLVWLCLGLLAAPAAWAAPDVADKFSIGSGGGTDHKPQSKLWYNDGTWWAIVYDGASAQRIWKFDGGQFVAQAYADAAVDSRAGTRADVLWDGTTLNVLAWHGTLPRFVKLSYDAATQTYHKLPGFPIDLPISGAEVMVFDQDSSGRLWASYELASAIHVIWTTTPDHLSWNTTGAVLNTNIGGDDICTTVAFGGDKIGVLWSDQSSDAPWEFGFRYHRDTDPPEVWSPIEIIDTGSHVDDHINVKADASGRIYFAGKDVANNINFYVREPATGWRRAASNINGGNCTRPCIAIDEAADAVHVFYTDWLDSPNPIKKVTAPRSTLVFGAPEIWLTPQGLALNNVTGTKQTLSARTGIMALASSSSSAYWGFENLDEDAPVATALDPTDEQVGVPLQPLVQIRLTDAGMGVRRNSIQMRLDGQLVTPTTAGDASEYLLTWSPPVPLESGRIYNITLTAEDYAYPPHSATESFRFRTVMTPTALDKKIDFKTASAPLAPGYEADTGTRYSFDRGWGWDKTMTMRRANVNPDLRLDTYVERSNSSSRATWTYELANGLYHVTFAAGAADAGGRQKVEIEGEVLINNQTTSSGQFLTISDYPIAVHDGTLDVKIGGGTSSKTQLCFLDFRYMGEAPPPPPPSGNEPPPRPVTAVSVARSGNDIVLGWNAVTQDTTGALIAVPRYHVYRGTTPGFQPDRNGHSNRVGVVSTTSFSDLGAVTAGTDLYYLVTAERTTGKESDRASNLGVRRRIVMTPPAGQQRVTWIALPYAQPYGNAQGLATAWNGGTGAGPVVRIARIERATQERQVWSFAGTWSGTNFSLVPGEAVEVTVGAPLTGLLLGSESATPAYSFAFRTAVGNVNWISLPQNGTFTDARSLVESMNGGTGTGPIRKLACYDPTTAKMVTWLWFADGWRGTNFAVQPGSGIAVLAGADLPLWKPGLAQP